VSEKPTKFERTYETESGTSTWYYDIEKNGKNPVRVEHNYTKEFLKNCKEEKKKLAKEKKSSYIKKKDRL
jgi:hypothetical protein